MGTVLTRSVVRTLRLRPAGNRARRDVCCRLPCIPCRTVSSLGWKSGSFGPPQDAMVQVGRRWRILRFPYGWCFVGLAVAPGVCEELAFRGFILSGLLRSARPAVAIVLSSIAFGIAHMVPQQVFNATLLGLVLGLLALRSGSLLPGILFHVTYNSLEMARSRLARCRSKAPLSTGFCFTTTKDNQHVLDYRWPALVVAALIASVLIGLLIGKAPKSDRDLENKDESSHPEGGKPSRLPLRSLRLQRTKIGSSDDPRNPPRPNHRPNRTGRRDSRILLRPLAAGRRSRSRPLEVSRRILAASGRSSGARGDRGRRQSPGDQSARRLCRQ